MSMDTKLDLTKKTFLLVTGASRGIGQALSIHVASKLAPGSVIVLVAKNADRLAKTKSIIQTTINKSFRIFLYPVDLEKATAQNFRNIIHEALVNTVQTATSFERAFIIHNAGTVGDVTKRAIDVPDTSAWTEYFHMNLFSAISLNCEFFRAFQHVPKVVVNLSSKCGVEPFASMSFYCSAKAARDMYFRVLALESNPEDTLVLNYAPGAIDTDMTVLVQQESINDDLVESFKEQRRSKTMLTTDETAKKFVTVLEERKFKSGDHVDYWD